uniref:Uncharacterized protein n=1 Tax=Arundo donax TaxID=35708 RepID=A0A0A9HPS8_ARUDO
MGANERLPSFLKD